MAQTFFFYDLETSGLKPREDRLMQFAGQRTDAELNPIGEPVNILVKMTEDALPSPSAIMVTKIMPQQTLQDGLTEAEFCRYAQEEIFTPETVALGYNTVRFDDEFMRALFWRNFYDPYEWEWKEGRSRWDLLDVVRLTRALRPEGINWPVTEEGKPTNRLELLTKANGLSHEHAHDALSDVYATISVARLIKEKQPKLYEFLFKNRGKREIGKYVNLKNPRPVVYASGRYAAEFDKTTVVYPIGAGRNGSVLVYDLRYDLEELLKNQEDVNKGDEENKADSEDGGADDVIQKHNNDKANDETKKHKDKRPGLFPTVKEMCLNKCPAVAPLGVLSEAEGWKKIGLSQEKIEKNLQILLNHPEFMREIQQVFLKAPEFPPAEEPEGAIYDGFLNDTDRVKVAAVRNADVDKLADFHPDFQDARLPELLLHYKGRNFPAALSDVETEEWERYRTERIRKQANKFMGELIQVHDDFIREELKLYLESVL